MKSGKGNSHNRSGTVGGGKGKRKRVVNTNVNSSSSSNNKSNRHDNNYDKRNGHMNNNNAAKNYNANSKNRYKKNKYDEDNDDDRPFNNKSVPSTTSSSYNNTSRKGKHYEEDKDRTPSQNNRLNGDYSNKMNNDCSGKRPSLLRDDTDEEKFTFEHARTNYVPSPYETKQIFSFGLDLNDNNRILSETFKSPFYKYYDEIKSESLPNIDFSSNSPGKKNDVLHQSADELKRCGWVYNSSTQTWSMERNKTSNQKGFRPSSKKASYSSGIENHDKNLNQFEVEFWRTVEQCLSENRHIEGNSQMRVDNPNSYCAD